MRITKENLTRYDKHLKSWHRDKLAHRSALENWHQTEDAGTVQFYPVGGSPLEGKVKFSFTETPPASGDKGPENPSTIVGVESIALGCRSKNMFDVRSSGVYDDVSISHSADGVITLNGVCSRTAGQARQLYTSYSPHIYRNAGNRCVSSIVHVGGTYTLPNEINHPVTVQLTNTWRNGNTTSYLWMDDTGTDSGSIKSYNLQLTTIDGDFTRATIFIFGGVTYNNYKIKVQYELTTDGIATGYEPPDVSLFTLPLGSTYYGGEIDLATGLMTVTHRYVDMTSVILNANVNYEGTDTSCCYFTPNPVRKKTASAAMSNRFAPDETATNFRDDKEMLWVGDNATTVIFRINKSRLGSGYDATSVDAIKSAWAAWFSSNPTYIVYQLATPYTVQLSPLALTALAQTSRHEPRLNTVYTDADSVQITYQKSPIRAATEQEMAILGLGGNV